MVWVFLRDAYDDFLTLVILNLLWVATTLLVVTAPAGASGLYYAANQMAHHESVDWRTFLVGFRRYWGLGWRWSLVNLVAIALMVFNYWFYGQYPAAWAPWVQGLFLGMVILWLLLQVYTFPLLLEQQNRRMRVALRNSLVLYLRKPGQSIGLVLLLLAIVVLSSLVVIPWLLFTGSLSVYLATRMAVSMIDELVTANPPIKPGG